MKIVNLKQFLALPEGTLFSKYKPCVFDHLMIKGESLPRDFLYQQITDAVNCYDTGEFVAILDSSQETGSSFDLDLDCHGRDGCFEDDQLFAVWEKKDVVMLMDRLSRCVSTYS